MKDHMKLLGFKVTEIVTGFTGVVTCISFDLYGCVQAVVTPAIKKTDKEPAHGQWFDVKRLRATSDKPVMRIPSFEHVPGGQKLPAFPHQPAR